MNRARRRNGGLIALLMPALTLGGCTRQNDASALPPPVEPGRAVEASPEAVYNGRTARQWLEYMRTLENNSMEWNSAAVEASTAFRALGPASATVVLEGLEDPQWHIREYCCFEIGKLGSAAVDAGAVEALVEAMRDEHFLVTESGAAGLGNLGMVSAGARARMIELLASADPFIRKKVAMELGALGATAREALPALEKLLQDPDADVREHAREAIENVKPAM